jgi:hypothetical protein
MVLALMIAMVMSTLTLALVSTGRAELTGARDLAGRTEARALSSSALEDMYARIQSVPGFADALVGADSNVVLADVHPGYTDAAARLNAPRWASFDGALVVPCPVDLQSDCFSVSSSYGRDTATGQVTSLLLDVTVRVRCGGVEENCLMTREQQRLRQEQFFDYLYFQQFSTLDPDLYGCADGTVPPVCSAASSTVETLPHTQSWVTNYVWTQTSYASCAGRCGPFGDSGSDAPAPATTLSCTYDPGPDVTGCSTGFYTDASGYVTDPPPPGYVDNGSEYERVTSVPIPKGCVEAGLTPECRRDIHPDPTLPYTFTDVTTPGPLLDEYLLVALPCDPGYVLEDLGATGEWCRQYGPDVVTSTPDAPPSGYVDVGSQYVRAADLDPAALCADRYAVRVNPDSGLGPRSSSCLDVAFVGAPTTGTDVIDGPVYTADDRVVVCGNPSFAANPDSTKPQVTVAGAGYGGQAWASANDVTAGSQCPDTIPPLLSSQRVDANVLAMPSGATSAQQAADIADPQYVIDQDAAINLAVTGSGASASTSLVVTTAAGTQVLPLPSPGVVVVNGDAAVSGTLAGRLTVFAAGDISIPADLTYASGGTSANTRDVLALVAGRSISIEQSAPYPDRSVNAVLVALSGSVYASGWSESLTGSPAWDAAVASAGRAPQLRLFGTIASKYQGVFSGFDPETGEVLSGYAKSFRFDPRPSSGVATPAYVVSPAASSWLRLPAAQAPVDMPVGVQAP